MEGTAARITSLLQTPCSWGATYYLLLAPGGPGGRWGRRRCSPQLLTLQGPGEEPLSPQDPLV